MSKWVQRLSTLLLAGWWLAMFVGTHVPAPELGEMPPHSDKWAHFLAYGGLAFLLCTWQACRRTFGWRTVAVTLGVTLVYAVADELLQIPVGRTADVLDGVCDLIGAAVGIGVFAVVHRAAGSRLFPVPEQR